jgi:hypothetical protein
MRWSFTDELLVRLFGSTEIATGIPILKETKAEYRRSE